MNSRSRQLWPWCVLLAVLATVRTPESAIGPSGGGGTSLHRAQRFNAHANRHGNVQNINRAYGSIPSAAYCVGSYFHAAAVFACSVQLPGSSKPGPACGLTSDTPLPPVQLMLRGGAEAYGREDVGNPLDGMKLPETEVQWDPELEKDPRWNRSVRIGFSNVVQSIRVIPADPGETIGGRSHVPDDSICEWFWADPRNDGATRPAPGARILRVPDEVPSVHRAVKSCPMGGIVAIGAGLFRWDGVIKLRKGLLASSEGTEGDVPAGNGVADAWNASIPDGSEQDRSARVRELDPSGGSERERAGKCGDGMHIRGVDGTVMMGQWLLGRHAAGSMRRVGLAGNFSVLYEIVLDVRSGPWRLEDVECRCVGGGLMRVGEWGEVDAQTCVFGGMGAELALRASSGLVVSGYGHVRLQNCLVTHLGGNIVAPHEQARCGTCACSVANVRSCLLF